MTALDELMDPENAPAVHGSWRFQRLTGKNVVLVDDDGCDLYADGDDVAALVNEAIARPPLASLLAVAEAAREVEREWCNAGMGHDPSDAFCESIYALRAALAALEEPLP